MKKRTGFTQIVMAIITIIAITASMVLNGSSAVAQPGVNQGEDLNLPDLNFPDLVNTPMPEAILDSCSRGLDCPFRLAGWRMVA